MLPLLLTIILAQNAGASAASAGSAPASMPASAPAATAWGQSVAGLSLAATVDGPWRMGSPMELRVWVRNAGQLPVALEGEGRFVWLLVAQHGQASYTERIGPDAVPGLWPARVEPGGVVALPSIGLAQRQALPYRPGLKMVDGYPAAGASDGASQPASAPAETFAKLLVPGPVRLKVMLRAARPDQPPIVLVSAPLDVRLDAGDLAELDSAARRRVLEDLERRFRKDAFSAQAAHHEAVRLGPATAEMLVRVLDDAAGPPFARMWAATALADVRAPSAAAVLARLLDDPEEGVRHVAAYHGPKLKDDAFDRRLAERATRGDRPVLTAWAILGHLQFRPAVPDELLKAGLDSPNPRTRAAVAETILRADPKPIHLPLLQRLLRDDDAQVRAAAARAAALIRDAGPTTRQAPREGQQK